MREIFGEYHHLLPELRSGDHEFCFRYLRMSPERSDHLLSLVKDKFIKEDKRFRKSILPEERSLLTLKFHVTGMSQQRLSFLFTIDKSTVGKIFAETCQAIYDSLKGTYRRALTTPNNLLRISRQFEDTCNFPHLIEAHHIDGKHIRTECSEL